MFSKQTTSGRFSLDKPPEDNGPHLKCLVQSHFAASNTFRKDELSAPPLTSIGHGFKSTGTSERNHAIGAIAFFFHNNVFQAGNQKKFVSSPG